MLFSSATGVRCWSRPWRRPTTTMNSVLIPGCWEAASDASCWQPPWLTKDLEDFSELYWCHLAQPQVGAASRGIVLKWRVSSKSTVPQQWKDIAAPPLWTLGFCRARHHGTSVHPSSNPSTPISHEPLRTTRSSVSTARRVPLSVPRWPLAERSKYLENSHGVFGSFGSVKYFGIWVKAYSKWMQAEHMAIPNKELYAGPT